MKWWSRLEVVQDSSGDVGDLHAQRGGNLFNACMRGTAVVHSAPGRRLVQ